MHRHTVFIDACTKFKAVRHPITKEHMYDVVSRASIGIIMNDNAGKITHLAYPVAPSGTTYIEFLALRIACECLVSMGVHKVDFYTDCINVALMVNQGIISGSQALRDLSYEILLWLDKFDAYTITWIPRRDNKEANNLARQVAKYTQEVYA